MMILYCAHPRLNRCSGTHGTESGAEWTAVMVLFPGTSVVLNSLFGKLQREVVTSSAEVNPDMLLRGAASEAHRKLFLSDLLMVLLSVNFSSPTASFKAAIKPLQMMFCLLTASSSTAFNLCFNLLNSIVQFVLS